MTAVDEPRCWLALGGSPGQAISSRFRRRSAAASENESRSLIETRRPIHHFFSLFSLPMDRPAMRAGSNTLPTSHPPQTHIM